MFEKSHCTVLVAIKMGLTLTNYHHIKLHHTKDKEKVRRDSVLSRQNLHLQLSAQTRTFCYHCLKRRLRLVI